ncbi:MAG: hypothetical protein C4558_07465 [Dehalococcoidia bacterium]|nr:MAG: hypothetical protein C4558_07465 [Dehalococcoidia bacterium]
MAQIEVLPVKDKWAWQRRGDDGKVEGKPKVFDTRAQSIVAAREAAGEERETLYNNDGDPVAERRVSGERVVLLREDGSEYGQLAAPRVSDKPQLVTLPVAAEADEAGDLDGGKE